MRFISNLLLICTIFCSVGFAETFCQRVLVSVNPATGDMACSTSNDLVNDQFEQESYIMFALNDNLYVQRYPLSPSHVGSYEDDIPSHGTYEIRVYSSAGDYQSTIPLQEEEMLIGAYNGSLYILGFQRAANQFYLCRLSATGQEQLACVLPDFCSRLLLMWQLHPSQVSIQNGMIVLGSFLSYGSGREYLLFNATELTYRQSILTNPYLQSDSPALCGGVFVWGSRMVFQPTGENSVCTTDVASGANITITSVYQDRNVWFPTAYNYTAAPNNASFIFPVGSTLYCFMHTQADMKVVRRASPYLVANFRKYSIHAVNATTMGIAATGTLIDNYLIMRSVCNNGGDVFIVADECTASTAILTNDDH